MACDVRAGTYIAAIILLIVAALGPIGIGLVDYARVVCLPRRKAWVDMPAYWRQLVQPANPRFQTFARAGAGADSIVAPLNAQHATGYRSGHTAFFNYNTRLTVSAAEIKPAHL